MDASKDDTNLPLDVETIGSSDAGNEPVFGDRETTTEAAGTDMMDGLDTTEQDIKFTKASTEAASECGANIECMAQCITKAIVPSETDCATTSLPDILKMVPDIIDGVINTLFDGATTEADHDDDAKGVTADHVVITTEKKIEATTVAGDVEFSTIGEIRSLEDPTLAKEKNVETAKATTISQEDSTTQDEGVKATTVSINGLSTTNKKIIEDIEATTVKMDEFTAEIPEDPEILDQATEVNTEEVVTT